MRQARPTLEDLGKYPHVIMTAAEEVGSLWDPTKFDAKCVNESEDDISALIDRADDETVLSDDEYDVDCFNVSRADTAGIEAGE